MTKTIIIRDDDTCYFTSPAMLERVYGRLWTANIPVSLAAIPSQRGDTIVQHRPDKPYDPSIPPQYRGTDEYYEIAENEALCRFLVEKAKAGLVEICLHGYNHEYHEFATENIKVLNQKLTNGFMGLLVNLEPLETIKTFIAPYDTLSPLALEKILEGGFNLCTMSHNFKKVPQFAHIGANEMHKVGTYQEWYTCDIYPFVRDLSPEQCLRRARQHLAENDLVIIVNHYWTFFYDWQPDGWTEMMAAWNQFVDDLLTLKDAKFKTFSDFKYWNNL